MATAPYSRKLNLTRDQLAQFLTNQQQIRQFEMLFAVADTAQYVPTELEAVSIQAGNADASANEALAQIIKLAQDTAINSGNADQKAVQALDELSRVANALELLALAPVHNNVELAHDVNGILPFANLPASVRSNQVLTWLSM